MMNLNGRRRTPRDGRVADGVERRCEHPGCPERGEYRAPRAPDELRSYRWFCLDHIRAFNQSWDYFAGWSQTEIERFQRESVTGHRPTWPLGKRPLDELRYQAARRAFHAFAKEWLDEEVEDDPNGARHDGRRHAGDREHTGFEARATRFRTEWAEALAVLDLDPPVSREALKRRYKELAKRHHPDANGGCRESEERLKLINRAYTYLRQQIVV
jgi:hypothetical protein